MVTVRSDGAISLSEEGAVMPSDLSARLRARLAINDATVQLNADQALSYERISAVLAACRDAGAEEVEVMTEERP